MSSVREFFGIESWPDDIVTFDLGGRELDIIPLPGHISDHIAVFDRQTGILLTGDTLYPGNLYIQNWQHFKESIRRLVDFAQTRTISHVLGTHIEMTNRAGIAFDFQSTYHPEEHELQLSVDHLSELDRALASMGEDPVLEVHDDFVIVP